jgi:hypothetical protein
LVKVILQTCFEVPKLGSFSLKTIWHFLPGNIASTDVNDFLMAWFCCLQPKEEQ